jgi:polar amino acid transport system permease protein
MGYDLNFTLIWRHFDKLWSGLILSLELAILSIAIGCIIGLVFAILYI